LNGKIATTESTGRKSALLTMKSLEIRT